MKLRRFISRHMPGLPDPFALEFGDSPFQIIVGPNGSGKSSICRALRITLWPGQGDRRGFQVESRWLDPDGHRWLGRIDGDIDWEREGLPARPVLPAEDAAAGYFFPLSDLLKAGEHDRRFAEDCLRKMAGGYDLSAWRAGVVFPSRKARSHAIHALTEARRDLHRLLRKHRDLAARTADRERIDAEIEAVDRDLDQRRTVEQALEYRRKRDLLETWELRLQKFPRGIENFSDKTLEDFDALSGKLEAKRREILRLQTETEKDLRQADALDLPGSPFPEREFQALFLLLDKARRREDDAAEAERQMRSLKSGAEERLARMDRPPGEIEVDLSAPALNRLDQALDELSSAWEENERVGREYAEKQSLAGEYLPERLRELKLAERLLGNLAAREAFAAENRPARDGKAGVGLLLRQAVPGLIGLALLIAGLAGETSLLLIAAAAALLLVSAFQLRAVFRSQAGSIEDRPLENVRARIAGIPGIEPPAEWTPDGISAALTEMELEIARQTKALQAERDLAALKLKTEESRDALDTVRSRLSAAFERVAGYVPAPETFTVSEIRRALDLLREWDEFKQKRTEIAIQAETARAQSHAALQAVRERLAGIDVPMAADGLEEFSAGLENLKRTWNERDGFRKDAQRKESRIAEIEEDKQELETHRRNLLLEVCVDPSAEDARERLLENKRTLPDYAAARREHDTLKFRVEELERILAETPELVDLDLETLERREASIRAQARKREELIKTSTEIEVEVRMASGRNDFELSESRLQAEQDRLQALATEAIEATIGDFLTGKVLNTYAGESRPAVLDRAESLFSRFTRGRYRLLVDPSELGQGEFRAVDTVLDRGLALDELSDATRVQLLTASRLAYAFEQERDIRPPLFLDETLSTSDPGRLEAIIEAMIELSGDRQVFYLCSDPGDAAAIVEACRRKNAPTPDVIDLAGVRKLSVAASRDSLQLPEYAFGEASPPPETDEPPTAYARRLQVPESSIFEPWTALDLYYVLEDRLDLLCRLRRIGLSRIGQVRGFMEHNALDAVVQPGELDLLTRRMAIARATHDACSVGRGRPVGREELADTGAVSDRFIDPLTAMARDLDGDARALIDRLEGQQDPRAKGFRKDKLEQLEQALVDGNYIDRRPALEDEGVLAAVLNDPPVRECLEVDKDAREAIVDEIARLTLRLRRLWEKESGQVSRFADLDPS